MLFSKYFPSYYYRYTITPCPKKPLRIFKTGCYFPKLLLNSKVSCIFTSFKKEISKKKDTGSSIFYP